MILNVDIYNKNNWLKIAFLGFCVFAGAVSLYYTDKLVSKLEEREKQQIEIYAEALKYLNMSDNDKDVSAFSKQIINANANLTIPVIYKSHGGFLESNNIEVPPNLHAKEKQVFLENKLEEIVREDNMPIEMDNGFGSKDMIYYGNSALLKQLRYYPLWQLAIVLLFGFLAYMAFDFSRRAEQNRVWVGLAKETAHQLGTPLSSLTAWVEFFKLDPTYDPEIVKELEKDIQRLDVITTRFSNIGSVPVLKEEDIFETVKTFMDYLTRRISTKVNVQIDNQLQGQKIQINKYLFEWVIENICKNAVDAMGGIGSLNIVLQTTKNNQIAIDISDTGKGISKANLSKVFNPGFSTKSRGWGLGLTLAKRIIENYHSGKLFIKNSEVGKGTTFRILLDEMV
jgi:signal transduction histidine kinase